MNYFKIGIILILILILIILFYTNLNIIILLVEQIFNKITEIKKENYIIFIFTLFLINFIYFLTPIPTFFLIIFNGYVLGLYGFLLSFLTIVLCSILLFSLIKNNKYILSFNYLKNLKKKINKNKNNDLNFFIIASSRYVLPYFLHNIFFGAILKNTKIFLYAIFLAEIPIILILNNVGAQLSNVKEIGEINVNNILKSKNLITFVSIFLLLFISHRASKYIKNKI